MIAAATTAASKRCNISFHDPNIDDWQRHVERRADDVVGNNSYAALAIMSRVHFLF
jgi:hypothetical protein